VSNFLCSCCNHQRAELSPVESNLFNQQTLLMCNTCIDARHQPRWLIIIAARSTGMNNKITRLIRDQKYCGKEITGKELF